MTAINPENSEQKNNDKELNFRKAEEAFNRRIEQERQEKEREKQARIELERKLEELSSKKQEIDEEDDDNEPYVDHRKLNKTLNKFGQNTQSEIKKAMEQAKEIAKTELKNELWLENNPDFYEVMKLADKFADKSPKLAETILRMPQSFERQKLVYENIKALGLDKPERQEPSIQEKINQNRRNAYYQPTGVSNPPYASVGDFSDEGQKKAYQKMQELKKSLRI